MSGTQGNHFDQSLADNQLLVPVVCVCVCVPVTGMVTVLIQQCRVCHNQAAAILDQAPVLQLCCSL
jgi:hypothetical protein